MKKILALTAFVTCCALGSPAATQTQNQYCDDDGMRAFTACVAECERRPLNNDQRLGCVLGCAIATGCP